MRSSKLIVAAGVAVMAIVAAVPALAQRVVVFGDSLSDTGNAALATGNASPGSPLGRFSNGLNWVDLLYGSGATGIGAGTPNSFAYDFTAQTGLIPPGKVLVYAFGGAYAGTGNLGTGLAPGVVTPPTAPPGTNQEIALFASKGGTFAPADIATIWAGANNGFFALGQAAANPANAQSILGTAAFVAVSNEVGNLQTLVALGAKKIIVVNLPDLGSTPAAIAQGAAAVQGGSLFSTAFNSGLTQGVGQLAAAVPTTNFIQADVASLFRVVISNAATFGFTNTTTFCGFNGGAACAGFVFADSVHPTQAAYALVAQYVGLLTNTTPALQQVARLGETGLYTNELVTNQVFDRMEAFISGTYADRNGPYAEIIGSYGTYNGSNGGSDLTLQIGGVRAGIDKKSGATLTGGSVTLLSGGISNGPIKSDLTSYRADAYTTALFGNTYVSGDVGISSLTLAGIARQTGFPTVVANGHTGGYVATAAAEAGFIQSFGSVTIIPSARLTYFHSQLNGYSESADLLAMSYNDRTTDAVLAGGKVRAVTNVAGIGQAATAFGEIGYEGFISSSTNNLTGQLVNNTALPTTVNPSNPNGPGIVGKVGLSSEITKGTFLDFQYGLSVHDSGGETHSGDIRLKATY